MVDFARVGDADGPTAGVRVLQIGYDVGGAVRGRCVAGGKIKRNEYELKYSSHVTALNLTTGLFRESS